MKIAVIAIVGMLLAQIIALVVQIRGLGRAKRRLQEGESRFRSIANSVPVLIWMLDASGGDEFFNDEWLRAVGGTRESARRERWTSRIHPEQSQEVTQSFADAFTARRRFDQELRLRCSGDLYRWVSVIGMPQYDAAGVFAGYVCSATDIEERRQLEGAKADLAHAARLVAIGELTAILVHEVKQPISAILANVEAVMLSMSSGTQSHGELISILEDIRSDDLRAADSIARIGALARKEEMRFEQIDLAQAIREVLRFVASDCNVHGVRAWADVPETLPPVYADRLQMQQVFLNLIMNAIDAMQESPVDSRQLTISASIVDAAHAEIAVSDTGTGIDEGHLGHVFDPFFTTKSKGTGLGLRVVRSIIASHNGTIRVENNRGPGATFRFTLAFAGTQRGLGAKSASDIGEVPVAQTTRQIPAYRQ